MRHLIASVIDEKRGSTLAVKMRRDLILTSKKLRDMVQESDTPFIKEILARRHRLPNHIIPFFEGILGKREIINGYLKAHKLNEIYNTIQVIKGIVREILENGESPRFAFSIGSGIKGTLSALNHRSLSGIALYVPSFFITGFDHQVCAGFRIISLLGAVGLNSRP